METDKGIILFDGVCNLCNKSVNFIIKRDKRKYFYFASIQSEIGQTLMEKYSIGGDIDSMILIEDGRAYTHDQAVLKIVSNLPFRWRLFKVAYVLPRSLRKSCYQLVARYRHRFFGKSDSCRLPSKEERAQFL
ncbi:thiol-disulfide oxidoreductase DCC family protein [Alkalicoccobacillus gibsonii]|uniref:thiol-disulfide oxidoreductase DCC family protein n=1 Tax=Alkalicoccobacillus gibsonii TaxID=79881 RepID=UPI003F7C7D34